MELGDARLAADGCPETYTDIVNQVKCRRIVKYIEATVEKLFTKTKKGILVGNVQ